MKAFLASLLALSLFACASTDSDDDGAAVSADDALSTSVSMARACAVRDAYLAAKLTDLKPLTLDQLPPKVEDGITASWGRSHAFAAVASMEVPGAGTIYVIDDAQTNGSNVAIDTLNFYDAQARHLLVASQIGGGDLVWLALTSAQTPADSPQFVNLACK